MKITDPYFSFKIWKQDWKKKKKMPQSENKRKRKD